MNWRYTIPIGLFLVVSMFLYRGLDLNPRFIPSPMIGKPAPEFSLPSLRDPNVMIGTADMKGALNLMNVWGTWCVECRYEHDFLLQLSESSGIPIYGFNLNDQRESALQWLETLGNPYVDSAADEEGYVAVDWGIYGAPETFLIDASGTILHKHISPLSAAVWERDFMPVIRDYCTTHSCDHIAVD
jgi:cytochrome c biogenesis protein CcmG/thiol:disulfide interchange protein DsbE